MTVIFYALSVLSEFWFCVMNYTKWMGRRSVDVLPVCSRQMGHLQVTSGEKLTHDSVIVHYLHWK